LEEVFENYCRSCGQGISSNEIESGIAVDCFGHEDCTEALHIRCMSESLKEIVDKTKEWLCNACIEVKALDLYKEFIEGGN
jgi:hypothetical protein